MDAIQLLKADHKLVKRLLAELTETSERATKKRTLLLQEIQIDLSVHTTIEEELFYPAIKAAGKKQETKMYFEALEEHRAVEELVLPDLLSTDAGSDSFSGRAKVLRELIEHHADEEESKMFKDAKALMSKEQLRELGAQMAQRKQELLDKRT
ncbi:hemerythrin domain-containing protein [Dyella monticola]|uniref:Hemerythrin domain-containing protein n=1 Tax=Dyella monticola TaxID=1927958 RepID=A0A370WSE1_9GAMM|nr:hemerythrin domain-containing protein [Dyella monticola]RDS78947.1 hemerythrin domain-containing protein [Dyella monticola]